MTGGTRSGRRGGTAAVALCALLVTACSPTSATSVSASGLERQPDGWRGIPVEDGHRLPSVTLRGTDGEPVALDEAFASTPTLLLFGYTNCPDICPIHLGTISAAMRTIGVGFDELDVVFVSVDPQRDTPERIEEYLAHFDRGIVGLHGDLPTVERALRELDLPGPVVEGADPRGEGDLIGHPAQVVGFDSDGTVRRMWPFGARRADWIDDLPRVLEEWA